MRSNPRGRLAAATLAVVLLAPRAAQAGLCGDASGDGFVRSGDALTALRMAVGTGYDRRADVKPSGGDSRVTAGDALEILRAAVDDHLMRCAGAGATKAVVTGAPYDFFSSGNFAVIDVATRAVTSRGGAVSGDAVIRTPSQTPVVVNRQGWNSLQFLDVAGAKLPNVKECSVADGFDSNPQDVALVSPNKGYVTPYAGGELLIVDPAVLFDPKLDPACSTIVKGRIDLSAYDSDGIPQMDQMALVGDDLYVTLQLLDDANLLKPKNPRQNGRIVVIDTKTDTIKGTIPLGFENPFAETKGIPYDEFQKLLFVGGPGTTGARFDDGGLEAIDPVTMGSAGVLLTGEDIDADLYDFVVVGTRRAFAIVADAVSNSVVELDLKTRTVKKTLLSSTGLITDIEMTDRGELWVAYRGDPEMDPPDPPGIRIFRVSDDTELTTTPLGIGQPPFTLSFLP